MFSFRRKSPKKEQVSPRIRASPSLPELSSQGIPWPENLVDVAAIQELPSPDHEKPSSPGGAKTSLQALDHTPIPFHKPFRAPPANGGSGSISALYMSGPPSAFETRRAGTPTSRYSQRRTRVPPTFNLMVVGGRGTGKTSLLRLLLETADISPTATADQRAVVDRFLQGAPKHTESITTACAEICESRFDRVLLSVIDTPGLDFVDGHELKLERQMNAIMKYVDAQYADTMSEESKVIRKSKGDQHIHLCIYMIDPSSIMTVAARRAQSSLPTKTRSETTVSYRTPDLVPDTSDDSDDESEAPLTMSPAEIRIIRRLSARSNVLPVIARADSLTDERLAAIKEAVRQGLLDAGLDFGVFGPPKAKVEPAPPKTLSFANSNSDKSKNGRESGHANGNGNSVSNGIEEGSEDEEEDPVRQARPVIKLRSSRVAPSRARSRSRSRRDLSEAAEDDHTPLSPDAADTESVANVRFSALIMAKTDLSAIMPFALIAPESSRRRRRSLSGDAHSPSTGPSSPIVQSEDGHAPSLDAVPMSPVSSPVSPQNTRNLGYLHGPPDDLKGVFTRKFRWGTVDVLNPDHCDFAALRTAVLSTHLKVLKTHTKEVLYEKYRTEKLLARRATRNISVDERERLLHDLGL